MCQVGHPIISEATDGYSIAIVMSIHLVLDNDAGDHEGCLAAAASFAIGNLARHQHVVAHSRVNRYEEPQDRVTADSTRHPVRKDLEPDTRCGRGPAASRRVVSQAYRAPRDRRSAELIIRRSIIDNG